MAEIDTSKIVIDDAMVMREEKTPSLQHSIFAFEVENGNPKKGSQGWYKIQALVDKLGEEGIAAQKEATAQAKAAASSAADALASKNAAASSASAASASASAAKTSETNAKASENAASASKTAAASSASAAAGSATAAKTSETNAANSKTAAASSASAAKASEAAAQASEEDAAASAEAALASKNAAKTSETNAKASENAAASSKTAAASSASAAATSASAAKTSETNAKTSETNAASSKTAAANSATAAKTSETNAANSKTAASNSASAAKTSETNAAASAAAAAGSEKEAEAAAARAETAADEAEALLNVSGAASTIIAANLTASRALVSDGSGKVAVSSVTSTELGYLDGVTSAVQTQINNKLGKTEKAASAASADKLTTARTISLTGPVTGSASFNGSANISIATTLPNAERRMPAGTILWFAGKRAQKPKYTLVCDGSAVSRTSYADLFAAIGTIYGAGDGSTTFNLPNLMDAGDDGNLGYFIRAAVDDASIGTKQADAIRNISGKLTNVAHGKYVGMQSSGVFSYTSLAAIGNAQGGGPVNDVTFDASRVVSAAEENRPSALQALPLISY